MKCPIEAGQGAEILLAYGSGGLDTEMTAAFAEHIRNCARCREQAAAQLAVWNALDCWDAPEVSPDFDRRLYARIENEVSWWDRLLRPLRPVLVNRGLPIAAATVAIVAAVLVGRPTATPEPVVPQSAAVETVSPDQAEQTLQDMETLREFNRIMRTEAAEPKM